MAEGEVLTAYSWPDARHLDGRTASLELSKVPCSDDDDIDGSTFATVGALVSFVSGKLGTQDVSADSSCFS